MFHKLCLSTCLLFCLWTGAFAQGKPELVLKGGNGDAVASKPDASLAPRAILARPPQSGKEPMLLLGPKNRPYTEQIKHSDKLEYFDCDGIVAPWFRELLVAEMNYFAELSEMPFVKGDACVVSIGTTKSLTPGRISIHLYTNTQRLKACIHDQQCPVFRSVSLIPKGQVLYRSYFLSDMSRKLIAQHCVTDKGKLHSDTTCYTVD
ncbi:MAG: hypothetical protein RLZZ457_423 [Pseudomonadota bacterium]